MTVAEIVVGKLHKHMIIHQLSVLLGKLKSFE